MFIIFPSMFRHCWLGDRKGIWPVKHWVLVCWWWWFDWSFARLIAPVVTTTSIILSSNKIQSGDIPVPANPGPPGKWPLKRRTRELMFVKFDLVLWHCWWGIGKHNATYKSPCPCNHQRFPSKICGDLAEPIATMDKERSYCLQLPTTSFVI